MSSIVFNMPSNQSSIIKVVGVGGGGSNAVNTMYTKGISGVEFCICNTDLKALDFSPVPNRIRLGQNTTEGLGAGADPLKGKAAAEESLEEIRELLKNNTKMVFITAGMGGGTGTGAAPVVARLAREMDILTVGIVTTPFTFEGKPRLKKAAEGLGWMRDSVDTLLVINNNNLFDLDNEDITQAEAFEASDKVLFNAAKGISDIINDVGEMGGINVDFADVRRIMKDGGTALMGSATCTGSDRARKAAEEALASPLLDNIDIRGSKGILVNITCNKDNYKFRETNTIMAFINEMAGEEAEVIMGLVYNPAMGDSVNVTVIATGFQDNSKPAQPSTMQTATPMETGYVSRAQTPKEPDFIVTPTEVLPPVVNDVPAQPSLFTNPTPQNEADIEKEREQARIDRLRKLQNGPYNLHNTENLKNLESEPAINRMKGNPGYESPNLTDRKLSKFSIDQQDSRNPLNFNDNPYIHGAVD
jgi:cell division protein FtsZ